MALSCLRDALTSPGNCMLLCGRPVSVTGLLSAYMEWNICKHLSSNGIGIYHNVSLSILFSAQHLVKSALSTK